MSERLREGEIDMTCVHGDTPNALAVHATLRGAR
jgi:lactam utilization protein B